MTDPALITDLVTGLLTEAVITTGRRLAAGIRGRRRGRGAQPADPAIWFSSYQPGTSPELDVPGLDGILRLPAMQALVHELLAVRLSGAPETEAIRIHDAMNGLLAENGDLADTLFAYYDGEIRTLTERLAADHPDLMRQTREEAYLARLNATLAAVERHTAALARPADPRAEWAFLARYRRHALDHHGMIEPPDFERRRRVAPYLRMRSSTATDLPPLNVPDRYQHYFTEWAHNRLNFTR